MFKIAICDDEKYFVDKIKKYIEEYLMEKEIEYEIATFSSGKELLACGIDIINYSAIFLDINMNEIDGISTSKKIREYSQDIYIVFVTAYVSYSLEGYKVGAVRYLLKNNNNLDNSIYECMDAILEKMNYVVEKKLFSFNEGEREVRLERLLYIESKLHKLEFHIMEEKLMIYTLYDTLNKFEKELGSCDFIRIHQSFLVNLKHISAVTGYKVILNNGQELIIPKARYKDVKNAFISYKGEL